MSDTITIADRKIVITVLQIDKSISDVTRDSVKTIGVGGFDVDLLDLGGAGDLVEAGRVHNKSVVEIDLVEIDGFADFVEDADNHEFLAHDFDGFADGAVDGIEESKGKGVAEDDGFFLVGLVKESAIADGEGFDF